MSYFIQTVSFEALLTTDMSRSFVVFNYDGPAVTIGEASTYHAQVGESIRFVTMELFSILPFPLY